MDPNGGSHGIGLMELGRGALSGGPVGAAPDTHGSETVKPDVTERKL